MSAAKHCLLLAWLWCCESVVCYCRVLLMLTAVKCRCYAARLLLLTAARVRPAHALLLLLKRRCASAAAAAAAWMMLQSYCGCTPLPGCCSFSTTNAFL